MKRTFTYDAVVTGVYDGDTVTLDIDLGLDCTMNNQKMRLSGINAPEMRGSDKEEGNAARDWLRTRILGKSVIIETEPNKRKKERRGKYGRWIVTIWLDNVDINEALVYAGHAVRRDYG